jgi:hypothetical protein
MLCRERRAAFEVRAPISGVDGCIRLTKKEKDVRMEVWLCKYDATSILNVCDINESALERAATPAAGVNIRFNGSRAGGESAEGLRRITARILPLAPTSSRSHKSSDLADGLGLSIAKYLVTRTVENLAERKGKGTKISFSIPA